MSHPSTWFSVTQFGLYCIPGKFYIDPNQPVDAALITHAHADHACPGSRKVLATRETLAIMNVRYGLNAYQLPQIINYYETIYINGVTVRFIPAGHILGSAQIIIEYSGNRIIISGDYKRMPDPTCFPFEVESADVFLSEATFGLPVFSHPPIEDELQKLFRSMQDFPENCHLIAAYPLGKCQRLIASLRQLGYEDVIYLHGSMIKLCELYQYYGVYLGSLRSATNATPEELAGKIIISPPGTLHDRWSRRFPRVIKCYASGWMRIRARAKQLGVELPLIVSDHSGWDELVATIQAVNAPEVWFTHGNEEALVYYAKSQGYRAHSLSHLKYGAAE